MSVFVGLSGVFIAFALWLMVMGAFKLAGRLAGWLESLEWMTDEHWYWLVGIIVFVGIRFIAG